LLPQKSGLKSSPWRGRTRRIGAATLADTRNSVAAVTVPDSAAATCSSRRILLHQRTVPFGSNACGFELNLNCARLQHYQRYMFGFCCSVGRSIGRCICFDRYRYRAGLLLSAINIDVVIYTKLIVCIHVYLCIHTVNEHNIISISSKYIRYNFMLRPCKWAIIRLSTELMKSDYTIGGGGGMRSRLTS
jgi:hypothetical protein